MLAEPFILIRWGVKVLDTLMLIFNGTTFMKLLDWASYAGLHVANRSEGSCNLKNKTGILLLLLSLLLPCLTARGGSAIWDHNPGSNDWNTAANWTPATVPNGPSDTAFFDLSNTTALSISANTEVNGIVFDSNAGLNPYTITASPGFTLTISGVGITNNSGTTQNFVAAPSSSAPVFRFLFKNSATAGSGTSFTMNGAATFDGSPGWTSFNDTSSAGSGTFTNNGTTAIGTFGSGVTLFNNNASASNGTFINNGGSINIGPNTTGGATVFNDTSTGASGMFTNNGATVAGAGGGITGFSGNSTAGNATIINNGADVSGASGGSTGFSGVFSTPTAGNATIINNGGTASGALGGVTSFEGFFLSSQFYGSATAGNATIINDGSSISGASGGETVFFTEFNSSNPLGASTAGNATLVANGGTGGGQGGKILFEGFSQGGTSRIEVFGSGSLDISAHAARALTVGSIEGSGNVFLGVNNLTIGSRNNDTTFSGVIQDGGMNGGVGGSLTKIGTGTLDLTGANTYTGNTNINSGVLKVDGSITSNTFVNRFGTLSGTGTVNGNVTNHFGGTVSPGDAPGTLTINGNFTQVSGGTLLIDIAGTGTGEFGVLDVLGTANLRGLLDPVLLNGFVPTIGESFTFLNYEAVTGTLGIFDRNIDSVAEHWKISYLPTSAILTVAAGNVPALDHGSTFLLLTLSLLGVATYRWQLLRRQA
jgi:autotransporter-associated beta strand protein